MRALEDVRSPQEIELRSFEIIEREIPEPRPYRGALWTVARRCIHAMGDVDILSNLRLSEEALTSGLEAMRRGCVVYTDTRMLAAGLVRRRMDPLGIKVVPLMALPGLDKAVRESGRTRAHVAVKMISASLGGNIIAIGNAPTALLALLNELKNPDLRRKPALIIGMPVGFVNASQSKELLVASERHCFALLGRKGGSAAAAACVNALAEIVLDEISSARGLDN